MTKVANKSGLTMCEGIEELEGSLVTGLAKAWRRSVTSELVGLKDKKTPIECEYTMPLTLQTFPSSVHHAFRHPDFPLCHYISNPFIKHCNITQRSKASRGA